VLARGGGFVDGGEFLVEAVVGGGVFVFEDGVALEGESVFAGVLGRAGLALGGAGSGGVLGVGAVGGGAVAGGRVGGRIMRNEARVRRWGSETGDGVRGPGSGIRG
jgi:hypothetical protein